MILNTRKRHFKSMKESALTDMFIMLGLFGLFFAVFVVMCISRKENIIEEIVNIAHSVEGLFFLFILLSAVYYLIKHIVYSARKRKIISRGESWEGTIVGVTEVQAFMNRAGRYDYVLTVQAPDGRTVRTEPYAEDITAEFGIRKCTVYEYGGRRYFTDFL